MRFKKISIKYKDDEGLIQKYGDFKDWKEALEHSSKLNRSVIFKKSEVEVISDADVYSPDWATHIAINSDGNRYDIRVENEALVRIERVAIEGRF